MKPILGREPAVAVESIAAVLLAVIVLVPAPGPLTVALNATVTAGASLAVALLLPHARDRVLPGLLSVVRALMAVWVGLGLALPEPTQAGIIGLVGAVAALFVRTQVTAAVVVDEPLEPAGR